MSYFMVGCKNTKTLLEDFVNKLPGEIDTDMTLPETLNKQEVTYTYKGTSLTSILPTPISIKTPSLRLKWDIKIWL